MQATKTAQVYAMIIANPGITAREISRELGSKSTGIIIHNLQQRGAIKAIEGVSQRSTQYYKGPAPVILRQAAGYRQTDINAASAETIELRNLQRLVAELQEDVAKLRKNSRYKLMA